MQRHPNVEEILQIEDEKEGLFDEPDWTLEELQPSVSDNRKLSVRSALDDIDTTYAAGGIEVLTDFRRVLSLICQDVEPIIYCGLATLHRLGL